MADSAAAVVIFQESLKWLLESIKNSKKFSAAGLIFDSSRKGWTPPLREINRRSLELGRPLEELVEKLIRETEKESQQLSSKNTWRKSYSFPASLDKLQENDDSLVSDLKKRDVLEILCKQTRIGNGIQMKGLCGAPESPEFTVGLDRPLNNLKFELLKDGVSILNLTGFGGSGKTTLARKLCRDDDIRGKFKENIMFVVFSKSPNLKIIVEKLFQHWGFQAPEFQSDESAVSGLELLLKEIGTSPKLLVLDDVWVGSESLVDKFKFQIPDYKILVTSRVAFPRFGTPCHLKPLSHDDALTLFRRFALQNDNTSNIPDDMLQQVVRGCRGSPLALNVVGGSLRGQPIELWQEMLKEWSHGHSILDSNNELLTRLQNSLNLLDDKLHIKECFMDFALFPEDQRIPVAALVDMWAELYKLDEDGIDAMANIYKLTTRNLANLVVTKEIAGDMNNNYKVYNNHFLLQHDLLRELAIHQSSQESFQRRERLILEINKNSCPEWWRQHRQQGLVSRILSLYSQWGIQQKQQVAARAISITTDEMIIPDWCNIQAAEAEVLVLNLRTKKYTLPEFMENMKKLKVLVLTNCGFHPSELNNFQLLGSLSNLKKIRLEKVSVPLLCKLKNLKKLSLYMCNINQAFESCSIPISDALPNLVELNIDYCKDLVELPAKLCDIIPLKKISISNCHKLSALPQEIGKLENLELLRLNSCTDLEELPDSTGKLHNLRFLDISNCISLNKLPEDIGNLNNLENLNMMGCLRCELPVSVLNLKHLKGVICDEETAASWEPFQPMLPQLRIEVPKVDINLNWLSGA
ncbi:hypothetical protein L6164_019944 [Bauhinia variegata]|uniref:Uncharacterized protein n=1 Tax=Bauhinia variegata TaxID=167791 RepID=A0ACB9MUT7_BAUVA|nr:hypothetical protein L6164_019944 [Bauhinia variegata]